MTQSVVVFLLVCAVFGHLAVNRTCAFYRVGWKLRISLEALGITLWLCMVWLVARADPIELSRILWLNFFVSMTTFVIGEIWSTLDSEPLIRSRYPQSFVDFTPEGRAVTRGSRRTSNLPAQQGPLYELPDCGRSVDVKV